MSQSLTIEQTKKPPRDYSKPPAMLVGREELRGRYGIEYSREHLWRLEKSGQFPKSIKLTANRCAWLAGEIEAWIVARSTAR